MTMNLKTAPPSGRAPVESRRVPAPFGADARARGEHTYRDETARYSVERLDAPRDARGCVFEPLWAEALSDQQNVHVAISAPGAVRGNHLHRRGTEVLTVLGPALVRLRQDDGTHDVEVPPGELYRFTIPPGVGHAVRNTGDAPGLLIAFSTVAYDPAAPDAEPDLILR